MQVDFLLIFIKHFYKYYLNKLKVTYKNDVINYYISKYMTISRNYEIIEYDLLMNYLLNIFIIHY